MKISWIKFIGESFISEVGEKFQGFRVDLPVDDVDEVCSATKILQVDVVDVSDKGEDAVLVVLHVQDPVDHFTLRHCVCLQYSRY